MFRGTEKISPAPTNNQAATLAINAPFLTEERANPDRDVRKEPRAPRRNRGCYYVFREGMLQMLPFDRQAIGW